MKIIEIALTQIDIGERRRTNLGDIAALAKGLKRVGLLNPIIVDRAAEKGRFRLIAGERRLKAARSLRWQTIPATLRDNLTDAELREIELEENENRKSLTEQERRRTFASSKKLVETAERAKAILTATAKTKKKELGRPPKDAVAEERIAESTGIPRTTMRDAEHHVVLAERYPWLQSEKWRQADVLRFEKELKRIPEPEQGKFCQFMERQAAPFPAPRPDRVLEYAEVMGMKTAGERAEIYRLSESGDERDQTLASTRALHRPPMPDQRLTCIREAMPWLQKAVKRPFDQEPEAKAFAAVIAQLDELRQAIQSRYDQLKKSEAQYVEEDVRRRQAISA